VEKQSYLTLRVGRQEFVMEASYLRGLLPIHDLASLNVPHAWLLGFAALRGHDLPVVDVRAKLGLAPGTHGRQPCIVVVEAAVGRLAGFVADRVSEIVELRERDFRGAVARVNGRSRRVLDPAGILTEEDFASIWSSVW
jgi:chemotaxis signal transduction protein